MKKIVLLIALGLLLASLFSVNAATLNVPTTYPTIQSAIYNASSGDNILVAGGTYIEDLTIPSGKDNLVINTSASTRIIGVSNVGSSLWPLAAPNIEILSSGVIISGFIIQSPAYVPGYYTSGIVVGASNVEISHNDFIMNSVSSADDVSQAVQTYSNSAIPGVDISGLNIHDNTFYSIGSNSWGYEAIYINRDDGTSSINIINNNFIGKVLRAISIERSKATISYNIITTDLSPSDLSIPGAYQGINIRSSLVQFDISVIGNIVNGSCSSNGFYQGVRIGNSLQSFSNIIINNNTIQGNTYGVLIKSPVGVSVNYNRIFSNAFGLNNTDIISLDSSKNWWGDSSGPYGAGPGTGDKISTFVTFSPWCVDASCLCLSIDSDSDGSWDCFDCNISDPTVFPGNPEVCDGKDNDCDLVVDEGFDLDSDNFTSCNGDCNDSDPSMFPGNPEVCDGKDNDCDSFIDHGFTYDNCQFVCISNGSFWTAFGGSLNCCGDDLFEASPYQAVEASCSDGNDNDCDGLVDCLDPDCAAKLGPGGISCCIDVSNCSGSSLTCKSCNVTNQCVYNPTTDLCNSAYSCSNSLGGNDYYSASDWRSVSQGYCDGSGSCDFSVSIVTCSLAKNTSQEGSGLTMCWDGFAFCRDTCADGLDNDGDRCADALDPDCGGPGCYFVPNIITYTPSNNSFVFDQTPLIYIRFNDTSINYSASIMELDYSSVPAVINVTGMTLSYTPTTVLSSGLHSVAVRVYDDLGNVAEIQWRFNVEIIQQLSPRNRSWVNASSPNIFVAFVDPAGVNTSTAVMTINGSPFAVVTTPTKVSAVLTSPLLDGNHTVSVTLNDHLGVPLTVNWWFMLDTGAPSISVFSPVAGNFYDSKQLLISVNLSEKVSSLRMSKNGGGKVTLCTNCYSYYGLKTFSENDHNATFFAEDLAGNTNTSFVSFLVDTLPPKIIKIEPKNLSYVKGTVFSVKYTEDNLQSMEIRYGPLLENSLNWTDCVSGSNKICEKTINLSVYNNLTVKYEVILRDFNHVVSSGVYLLKVDKDAPFVSISEPVPGYIGTRRVKLSASVNEVVDEIQVSIDGRRFNRVCSDCINFSKFVSLNDNNHSLVVRAIDYAGNVGELGVIVIVDSNEPKIIRTIPSSKSIVKNSTSFSVAYSEDDLISSVLHYGVTGNEKFALVPGCLSGNNKICSVNLDLVEYNGQMIYYYFNLSDHLRSSLSKTQYITVDTTSPIAVILSPTGNVSSGRVPLKVSSSEPATLQYSIDYGRFTRLCSSCTYKELYINLRPGLHTIKVQAIDPAGNIGEDVEIVIAQ